MSKSEHLRKPQPELEKYLCKPIYILVKGVWRSIIKRNNKCNETWHLRSLKPLKIISEMSQKGSLNAYN